MNTCTIALAVPGHNQSKLFKTAVVIRQFWQRQNGLPCWWWAQNGAGLDLIAILFKVSNFDRNRLAGAGVPWCIHKQLFNGSGIWHTAHCHEALVGAMYLSSMAGSGSDGGLPLCFTHMLWVKPWLSPSQGAGLHCFAPLWQDAALDQYVVNLYSWGCWLYVSCLVPHLGDVR